MSIVSNAARAVTGDPGGMVARGGGMERRLNALRAGVLGANDGIVSIAAVVVGVAGATTEIEPILVAGLAASIGGAISMALGEYVSVSSQRDTEKEIIEHTRLALADRPDAELASLAKRYEERGVSAPTAAALARELSAVDALGAHLHERHNLDRHDVASPWHAAAASFVAFALGAVLPMLAILLPPVSARVPVAFAATLVALALTGMVAAGIGGSSKSRAALAVVVGGTLALGATYLTGMLLGTTGVV